MILALIIYLLLVIGALVVKARPGRRQSAGATTPDTHRVECSWCGDMIKGGVEPVSHGCCERCLHDHFGLNPAELHASSTRFLFGRPKRRPGNAKLIERPDGAPELEPACEAASMQRLARRSADKSGAPDSERSGRSGAGGDSNPSH